MRRRTFLTLGGGSIEASKAVAGDVCLYDKINKGLIIIPVENIKLFPSSNYSPIGVVVVPGTHNVYGDGSCGVVSLVNMSYNTPNVGDASEDTRIYMATSNYVISSQLESFTPYIIGSGEEVSTNKIIGSPSSLNLSHGSVYLPSDKFNTLQCPHDTDAYYDRTDYYINQVCSPYLTNETRNPTYYDAQLSSSYKNCFSDFDGYNNTQKLITQTTGYQPNWKTDTTIEGKNGPVAACCCWRYHTEGTSQGDWYLPTIAELGYLMTKFIKIKNSLSSLISSYNEFDIFLINEKHYHWTSTKAYEKNFFTIGFNDSYITNTSQEYNHCVRSFLRVK